jgi:DNA repair protein RadC
MTTLFVRESLPSGRSRYRPATTAHLRDAYAIEAERDFMERQRGKSLLGPAATREFLRARIGLLPHESFYAIFLDNRHRVIACEELFRGTIDGASVHPREVARRCFELTAQAIILAHNHPSGVAEPSQADELITHRLRDALALLDVRVIDHLIVTGHGDCASLAERGLI